MKTTNLSASEALQALMEGKSIRDRRGDIWDLSCAAHKERFVDTLIYWAPYSLVIPDKTESEKAENKLQVNMSRAGLDPWVSDVVFSIKDWVRAYVKEQGEKK